VKAAAAAVPVLKKDLLVMFSISLKLYSEFKFNTK